jgi:hypothetical protein
MADYINCDQCGQLTTKNTQWHYLPIFWYNQILLLQNL